jgi:hypothetical protein
MTQHTGVKRLPLVLVFSLVLLGCAPVLPVATPTTGPLDLVKALEAAMIQDDVETAIDLFVDGNPGYSMVGFVATDKETLRWLFDGFAVLHDDEFRDCRQEGEKVTCTLHNRGICRNAEGIEVLHIPVTFTFQDHKIRSMVGNLVPEEEKVVSAGEAKIMSWSMVHRPDEYRNYSYGELSGLTGQQWGEVLAGLCGDYLEATSQ